MPYVRSSGATIHYLTQPAIDRCPPRMPCVLFIHGGGGSAYQWLQQLPYFAGRGFLAVALSVRGWGQSTLDAADPALYASGHLAADAVAVLDALGVARAAVVGHSVGGFVAARLAVEHPHRVSHLVMSCTIYGMVDEQLHRGGGGGGENATEEEGSHPDSYPGNSATPWVTRYVNRGAGAGYDAFRGPSRDSLAAAVKEQCLAVPAQGLGEKAKEEEDREENEEMKRWLGQQKKAEAHASRRSCYPTKPDNLTTRFRARRPDLSCLLDSLGDGNHQVAALGLKARFKVLHACGAVTPSDMRAAYAGPLLFATAACDAHVHWELVALVAAQCAAADDAAAAAADGRRRRRRRPLRNAAAAAVAPWGGDGNGSGGDSSGDGNDSDSSGGNDSALSAAARDARASTEPTSAVDTAADAARTVFHCWRGDLRHGGYLEDAAQFNAGLLAFFLHGDCEKTALLPEPSPASSRETAAADPLSTAAVPTRIGRMFRGESS